MRVKKKKVLKSSFPFRVAEKNAPFWYACTLALLCTSFFIGMSVVGLRAAENQYIDSYAVISLEPSGPVSYRLSVLGWDSEWDFSIFNQAAGWVQKAFPLIPAPLRFGKQLVSLGEQAFLQMKEIQRQREFIESV